MTTDLWTPEGRVRAAVAAAVAALCAAPYLVGAPVWDDHLLIEQRLGALWGVDLAALFAMPLADQGPGAGYYRPLSLVVLAIAAKLSFFAIHALTLLLHAGSAALLTRLLSAHPGAFVASLAFAAHPIASETLGWASALPDALAVHLGLWSIWTARSPVLAGALVLTGALCKETALLFLPFAILGGLVPRRAGVPWAIGVSVAIALRLAVGAMGSWSLLDRLPFLPDALAWPVAGYLIPWPLTAVRDLHATPDWVLPAALAIVAAAAAACRGRALARAGLGLAITAPALALPPTLDGFLASERYAYPGLVGVAFYLAALVPARLSAPRRMRALQGAVALALVACVTLHGLRAPAWRDDRALFESATRALPESSYAWHFLGVVQLETGDPAGAAQSFERALDHDYAHWQDRANWVRALVEAGQPCEAVTTAGRLHEGRASALDLAWWARSALECGRPELAAELIAPLRRPHGYDGPSFVASLAGELATRAPAR